MQIVSCPSCGAEVAFRSHASVMAVCEYCATTVLKDADTVKDFGKMSAVLEDYSPIQIGTTGVLAGRQFTVIGRIQLRYAAGLWNEWYLLFDDRATAWLGDSSGLYTITAEFKGGAALPAFDRLKPGNNYTINGAPYTAAEIRVADCVGGQGELPFLVGDGYQAKVADLRRGAEFITLDYSDAAPVVYTGTAVTLASLRCQLLRDDDTILRAAGRYRGTLSALDCPSCGSAIKYLPGASTTLVCAACQAQIDVASAKAQVIAAGERVASVATTIELGATAKIKKQDVTVIGAMRRADDDGAEWTEYLLYGANAGFSWLVETDDGWSSATVLAEWPQAYQPGADHVMIGNTRYNSLYTYGATVTWAAGAFNWRVAVGDVTEVEEYQAGQYRLARETTAHEMTWSRSRSVAGDQVKAWFGAQFRGEVKPARSATAARPPAASPRCDLANYIVVFMLVINAIPLLMDFSSTWYLSALGVLAIYLPADHLDKNDKS
ncbi:hypothetical protein ASF61_14645 [Duganella sp. Leaf126]|uniref:DUF4178 domain-containing protein n=1 Tax=Duganella sp. Leaf126 TaxID=1736266 RepID=UPI0006F8F961|nr:DUF4178 domain-containing protein [Duganella sp. Leaf126]KQQ32768.1 hypothetical protein ASF61_14645 [Duganella sp. Leaf126]